MALNYITRSITVFEALINRTATAIERQRLLDAFALLAPAGATNAEIAGVFLNLLRRTVLDQMNAKDRATVAAAAVTQNAVDFAETP